MTRHTYLSPSLITYKGTAFTSHLVDEIAKILLTELQKTQISHRLRLLKNNRNTTIQDYRPEGNLQADDEITIPQDDLYIISWETNLDNFSTHSDLKDNSDDSAADSDQQNAIFTNLDLRSIRLQENTDTAAPEPGNDETNDMDLRSTRPQQDTNSDQAEQPTEDTADPHHRSTRPQNNTDSENDEMTSQSPSKREISIFQISGGRIPSCPMYSTKEMMIQL